MADTLPIIKFQKDVWYQLPNSDAEFVFTNSSRHNLYVRVSTSTPTDMDGMVLQPYWQLTRIAPEPHWILAPVDDCAGHYTSKT